MSTSVSSNVPDFEEPKCFVVGDCPNVVESCLEYLNDISRAAYILMLERYGAVFQQIEAVIDEDLKYLTP